MTDPDLKTILADRQRTYWAETTASRILDQIIEAHGDLSKVDDIDSHLDRHIRAAILERHAVDIDLPIKAVALSGLSPASFRDGTADFMFLCDAVNRAAGFLRLAMAEAIKSGKVIDPEVFTAYAFFERIDIRAHPHYYRFARWIADCTSVFGVDLATLPSVVAVKAAVDKGHPVPDTDLVAASAAMSDACREVARSRQGV